MTKWYVRGIVFVVIVLIGGISSGAIIWDDAPIAHHTTRLVRQTTQKSDFSVTQIKQLSGMVFSSPKESLDRWRSIISQTKGTLDVWMYDITYNRAKLPLVKLAEQGVKMRLILEDGKYQSYGDSYIGTKALLEDVGVQVMSDSDLGLGTNYVHAKVFVSSGRSLIQTANLTNGGFNTSREYYTYVTDPGLVHNIQQLFNADRKGKPLTADQIHSNLLVCPINCRDKIQALIQSAKKSIIIQNQYIEDEKLRNLLASRQLSGVTIEAVLANNDFSGAAIQTLGNASVAFVRSPYPHAKVMLIDDAYLLISSINYSSNSMDNNREIGVIVTNRDAIEYFKQRFREDWARKANK